MRKNQHMPHLSQTKCCCECSEQIRQCSSVYRIAVTAFSRNGSHQKILFFAEQMN